MSAAEPLTTVLLMAYGSPATLADVEAYYTHIRRGRKPSPEELANLVERYERIGGASPLLEITRQQGARLLEHLRQDGDHFRLALGMKHAPPFIADAVAEEVNAGTQRLVTLALAPHYSRMSIGGYLEAAAEALGKLNTAAAFYPVESWCAQPLFQEVVAAHIGEALAAWPGLERGRLAVIFTAHSLPERILSWGDPYPQQLTDSAASVARRAGLREWHFAFQSAGHTGDPWLEPDINDEVRRLAEAGHTQFLIVPIGFVSDHLEILYDLDIELQQTARELGVECRRTRSLNTDPRFIDALAAVVRERLAAAPAPLAAGHQVV